MNRKEHLTIEGLRKIVAIKASINLGLSSELKQRPKFRSKFRMHISIYRNTLGGDRITLAYGDPGPVGAGRPTQHRHTQCAYASGAPFFFVVCS